MFLNVAYKCLENDTAIHKYYNIQLYENILFPKHIKNISLRVLRNYIIITWHIIFLKRYVKT